MSSGLTTVGGLVNDSNPASCTAAAATLSLLYDRLGDLFSDDLMLLIVSWRRLFETYSNCAGYLDTRLAALLGVLLLTGSSTMWHDIPTFAMV